MLKIFEHELKSADYIIVPSGSCATMMKKFYAQLFADDAELRRLGEDIGPRILELSQFLVEALGIKDVGARYRGRVTYQESCHLLRELNVSKGPRQLIEAVRGVEFVEMDEAGVCCGFGGVFSVKYPEISTAMAQQKVGNINRSGADRSSPAMPVA